MRSAKKLGMFLLTAMMFVGTMSAFAENTERTKYVGGDISMLPEYEKHNSGYKDASGAKIPDLLVWLNETCGWNTFRVRLFVNPTNPNGDGVLQTTEYVKALGQRIKAQGAYFMLDFHYSDTWVDATHIQAPEAWKGLDDAAMAAQLGEYTRAVLDELNSANATPDLVQVGNEIMYGLCGIKVHPYQASGDNWAGYAALLKAGCEAVREKCPEAKIIIHSDRPTNTQYNKFYYGKLLEMGVDYDVIGLSYYPFWHGYLTAEQVAAKSDKNYLGKALAQLATDFPDKEVQIVETAYNFQYWPTAGVNYDTRDAWPCSKKGQYEFVRDLVSELLLHENVTGLSYWFPEEAGNGDDTNWSTSQGTVLRTWLNRGLWDENMSQSGHALNVTGAQKDNVAKEMGRFVPEVSALESIDRPDEPRCRKQIVDGRLEIIREGIRYSVWGL